MKPESLLDGRVELHCGDCLNALDEMPADSIDAGVTDPPYHLASIVKRFGGQGAAEAKDYSGDADRPNATGAFARSSRGFMGKQWDGGDIAFRPETWAKVLRVLKPGAHLVAFAAPKNVGHLQVAIEAAGFEVRDCIIDLIDLDPVIAQFVASLNDAQRCAFLRCVDDATFGGLLAWVFGSGFPKSHSVALDFERRLCHRVEVSHGREEWVYVSDGEPMRRDPPFRYLKSNAWAGYGTALKPAFEPIVLARKPLIGSVAENVDRFGTGALNIDHCRIASDGDVRPRGSSKLDTDQNEGWSRPWMEDKAEVKRREDAAIDRANTLGRWPANIITDGSDVATAGFPETGAAVAAVRGGSNPNPMDWGNQRSDGCVVMGHNDNGGSAGRFFYNAKADSDDRLGSNHPTVKPLDLMQWLIRLVTAPGQTVLDPFAGTGTTGEAAFREGRRAVLIEREAEYQADIRRRMRLALGGPDERKRESIKQKTKGKPIDAGPLFGGEP